MTMFGDVAQAPVRVLVKRRPGGFGRKRLVFG